jgi:hypothetical protein
MAQTKSPACRELIIEFADGGDPERLCAFLAGAIKVSTAELLAPRCVAEAEPLIHPH